MIVNQSTPQKNSPFYYYDSSPFYYYDSSPFYYYDNSPFYYYDNYIVQFLSNILWLVPFCFLKHESY